jgi:hypothetical protein
VNFHKLISRYHRFGGIRLIWLYAKLGILPALIKGLVRCVIKRQSFEFIYPKVLKRMEPLLIKKYESIL